MNKNILLYIPVISTLLLLSQLAVSSETQDTPEKILKTTTYNLIEGIKQSREQLKQDPGIIKSLVTTHVAPKLDFIAASRWVLGKHWRDTDRSQKIRFIKEFRKLLIQFYSSALAEYTLKHDIEHDLMTFLPLRDKDYGNDVTLYSIVTPPSSRKKVAVNYHMHNTRKGWKIYDVSIEGISMITTYKSSFAPKLRNLGVDGLITSLTERNTKLAATQTSARSGNN